MTLLASKAPSRRRGEGSPTTSTSLGPDGVGGAGRAARRRCSQARAATDPRAAGAARAARSRDAGEGAGRVAAGHGAAAVRRARRARAADRARGGAGAALDLGRRRRRPRGRRSTPTRRPGRPARPGRRCAAARGRAPRRARRRWRDEPAVRALGLPPSLADAQAGRARDLGPRDHRDRSAHLQRVVDARERAPRGVRHEADRRARHRPARRARSRVPGDKSIGHRALLFSLLSATPMRVLGLGDGADNGRSAKAITALGARDRARRRPALVITGTGLDGMRAPAAPIDCGNSGTTIRLLCGLLAGQRFATTLFGDESLSKRPMRRVIEPLAAMGASIAGQGGQGADVTPPLVVGPAAGPLARDRLRAADGVGAGQDRDPARRPVRRRRDRRHRARAEPRSLRAHARLPRRAARRRPAAATTIDTRGWDRRLAGEGFEVPGDPSSAAFLVAAALVAGAARGPAAGRLRQPDAHRLPRRDRGDGRRASRRGPARDGPRAGRGSRRARPGAGAARDRDRRRPRGALDRRAADPRACSRPARAARRSCATPRSCASRSRDRIATTCAMLRAFGVTCEERPDGFAVEGRRDRPLAAGARPRRRRSPDRDGGGGRRRWSRAARP